MLNILGNETLKLKRNKLLPVCTIIALLIPSLFFSCLVSGVEFAGLYWPEKIRNFIPWSAVTSIGILDEQELLPYVSIILC